MNCVTVTNVRQHWVSLWFIAASSFRQCKPSSLPYSTSSPLLSFQDSCWSGEQLFKTIVTLGTLHSYCQACDYMVHCWIVWSHQPNSWMGWNATWHWCWSDSRLIYIGLGSVSPTLEFLHSCFDYLCFHEWRWFFLHLSQTYELWLNRWSTGNDFGILSQGYMY